jgi:hypothetical protein
MIIKIFFPILLGLLLVATDTLPDIEQKQILLSKPTPPTPAELFMRKIAVIESGGNHKITNEFGMMGKYQFSPSTVRLLGFRVSKEEFLKNPHLQDTVMLAYMKTNHRELEQLIRRFDGKTVGGIKVTRAGILAGAHFAGSHGVRRYLTGNGTNISDARGTTVSKYMSYFSNFQLPQI